MWGISVLISVSTFIKNRKILINFIIWLFCNNNQAPFASSGPRLKALSSAQDQTNMDNNCTSLARPSQIFFNPKDCLMFSVKALLKQLLIAFVFIYFGRWDVRVTLHLLRMLLTCWLMQPEMTFQESSIFHILFLATATQNSNRVWLTLAWILQSSDRPVLSLRENVH